MANMDVTKALRKPEFILVPGAWHDPSAFAPTTALLEDAGYTVHGVTLPSVGPKTHLKSFAPDAAAISAVVNRVLNSDKDAVILFHSYGGAVGSEALKGYITELELGMEVARPSPRGQIKRIIYCSAFALPAGVSLMMALQNKPLPWFVIKDDAVTCSDPQEIFYNDIDPQTAAPYINALKEHSYPTFSSQVTCEPYMLIPSTYIICEKDNAIPAAAQEGMIAQVKEKAQFAFNVVERIDASHSPFISQPEILAQMMIKAATEN